MKEEATQRVLSIVKEHPGEYSSTELIRQLRASYIDEGQDDIGLKDAQEIVNNAIDTGKIQLSVPEHLELFQVKSQRCYPTD